MTAKTAFSMYYLGFWPHSELLRDAEWCVKARYATAARRCRHPEYHQDSPAAWWTSLSMHQRLILTRVPARLKALRP